jgi:hypothetical protein
MSVYFPFVGSTISRQCRQGRFIRARAYYAGTGKILHGRTGDVVAGGAVATWLD